MCLAEYLHAFDQHSAPVTAGAEMDMDAAARRTDQRAEIAQSQEMQELYIKLV